MVFGAADIAGGLRYPRKGKEQDALEKARN